MVAYFRVTNRLPAVDDAFCGFFVSSALPLDNYFFARVPCLTWRQKAKTIEQQLEKGHPSKQIREATINLRGRPPQAVEHAPISCSRLVGPLNSGAE